MSGCVSMCVCESVCVCPCVRERVCVRESGREIGRDEVCLSVCESERD